jgi:hypothetical protein
MPEQCECLACQLRVIAESPAPEKEKARVARALWAADRENPKGPCQLTRLVGPEEVS